jgi:hypothetical protein
LTTLSNSGFSAEMLKSKRGFIADPSSGSEDLDFLAKIAKKCLTNQKEPVTALNFGGKGASDENLRLLSEYLVASSREFPQLQSVELTYNIFTHSSMDDLSNMLKRLTTINSLDIAENNIGIKGSVKLSSALRADMRCSAMRLCSLLSVILIDCYIGRADCWILPATRSAMKGQLKSSSHCTRAVLPYPPRFLPRARCLSA